VRKISYVIFLVAVMGMASSDGGAQSLAKRFMIGMAGGTQRLYGDGPTTKWGIGGEGQLGYRFTGRLGTTLVGGFATLPYSTTGVLSNRTSILYGDLLFDFELLNKGRFRPYLMVGGGGYNYKVQNSKRYIDGSGIGGFGVRWLIAHALALDIHSSYHFTPAIGWMRLSAAAMTITPARALGSAIFAARCQARTEGAFSEGKTEVVEESRRCGRKIRLQRWRRARCRRNGSGDPASQKNIRACNPGKRAQPGPQEQGIADYHAHFGHQ
jgi:hypothetical protein